MAILTNSGRAAIAAALASRPLHLAWGTGGVGWPEDPPPESATATTLTNEIGRRTVHQVAFCTPDENGSIVVPNGRYAPSATPTNHLYLVFKFDFTDAPAEVIREIGVFTESVMQAGLPPGQMYFTPANVSQVGVLLHLEHLLPLYRTPATRESFEIVITF